MLAVLQGLDKQQHAWLCWPNHDAMMPCSSLLGVTTVTAAPAAVLHAHAAKPMRMLCCDPQLASCQWNTLFLRGPSISSHLKD